MAKRVVIFGTCGAHVDAKALKAVVRFVSATQPESYSWADRSRNPTRLPNASSNRTALLMTNNLSPPTDKVCWSSFPE
jgi:hypothetical protein